MSGRVKTFTNGGKLYPGDLNSIEDSYEGALAGLRTLAERVYPAFQIPGAATDSALHVAASDTLTGALDMADCFYLDPADLAAGTQRTAQLRVRAILATNGTAPATSLAVGLYSVTVTYPVAIAAPPSATLLALQGVAATSATPAASSTIVVASADFTPPAAGLYALAVHNGGAGASNSRVHVVGQLQAHLV